MHPYPRFIGLCGNPKAGKSLAQELLQETFSYVPVDDGYALRAFAVNHLGLTWPDVQTQEGKARHTEILGRKWQNREILGEVGNLLETMFGEHIMPFMAMKGLDPHGRYSFGSVRKTQGHFIRERGGIVLEIRNPLAAPSPFAFDKFDQDAVTVVIENDAQARGLSIEDGKADLLAKLKSALKELV